MFLSNQNKIHGLEPIHNYGPRWQVFDAEFALVVSRNYFVLRWLFLLGIPAVTEHWAVSIVNEHSFSVASEYTHTQNIKHELMGSVKAVKQTSLVLLRAIVGFLVKHCLA